MPVARIDANTVVFSRSGRKIRFSGRALALGRLDIDLGIAHVAAHVEDQQRRQDAQAHEHAPRRGLGEQLEHEQVGQHGDRPSDGPRALDDAERLAARLRAHHLGHEHCADRPLAAEADALEDAEDHEHLVARGQAGQEREQRVDRDGEHQRARAADAVRQHAAEDAAERGRRQRHG
jgi:hypothetical protein